MELILKNPEKYNGYLGHPINSKKEKVIFARIYKSSITGFSLEILFESKKMFNSWSSSILGAKQLFAFQCRKGAEWSELNTR